MSESWQRDVDYVYLVSRFSFAVLTPHGGNATLNTQLELQMGLSRGCQRWRRQPDGSLQSVVSQTYVGVRQVGPGERVLVMVPGSDRAKLHVSCAAACCAP